MRNANVIRLDDSFDVHFVRAKVYDEAQREAGCAETVQELVVRARVERPTCFRLYHDNFLCDEICLEKTDANSEVKQLIRHFLRYFDAEVLEFNRQGSAVDRF